MLFRKGGVEFGNSRLLLSMPTTAWVWFSESPTIHQYNAMNFVSTRVYVPYDGRFQVGSDGVVVMGQMEVEGKRRLQLLSEDLLFPGINMNANMVVKRLRQRVFDFEFLVYSLGCYSFSGLQQEIRRGGVGPIKEISLVADQQKIRSFYEILRTYGECVGELRYIRSQQQNQTNLLKGRQRLMPWEEETCQELQRRYEERKSTVNSLQKPIESLWEELFDHQHSLFLPDYIRSLV